MAYIFRGRLCGYICAECPEPLSPVTVRLYRSRPDQNVTVLAVATPKDTTALLTDDAVRNKAASLLAETDTAADGTFTFELGDKENYTGGPFEIDVSCATVLSWLPSSSVLFFGRMTTGARTAPGSVLAVCAWSVPRSGPWCRGGPPARRCSRCVSLVCAACPLASPCVSPSMAGGTMSVNRPIVIGPERTLGRCCKASKCVRHMHAQGAPKRQSACAENVRVSAPIRPERQSACADPHGRGACGSGATASPGRVT